MLIFILGESQSTDQFTQAMGSMFSTMMGNTTDSSKCKLQSITMDRTMYVRHI